MTNSKSYFSKFPTISYDGTPSLNILKRVDFNSNIRNFLTHFYPLSVPEGTRIDSLAFDYYNSVDLDWLIYHANGMIDPYYDSNKSNYEFEKFIKRKYGSLRLAKRKIKYYANNYRNDDQLISTTAYDSLPSNQKRYWKPESNALGVVGYSRSSEQYFASTNIHMYITFTTEANSPFSVGELIHNKSDAETYGEVTWSDSNGCNIQHVIGDYTPGITLVGESSKQEVIINETKVITDVIPIDERVYYSPISYYDYEMNKNSKKQEVYLIDRTQANRLNEDLKNLLS